MIETNQIDENRILETFKLLFPDYKQKIETAKSDKEIQSVFDEVKEYTRNNAIKEITNAGIMNHDFINNFVNGTEEKTQLVLTNEQYQEAINAGGDDIKQVYLKLIEEIEIVGKMINNKVDNKKIAMQMVLGGFMAAGDEPCIKVIEEIRKRCKTSTEPSEKNEDDPDGVPQAAVAVVLTGSLSGPQALIFITVVLIIIAVIIPMVYFMSKEARCFVLVINELINDDKKPYNIIFDSEHNVSGKPSYITKRIDQGINWEPEGGLYPCAGFFSSSKKDAAFYGTQYGFKLKIENTYENIAFGVECPLTALYTDNNCYCGFSRTAKDAAENSGKENKQSWEAERNGFKASIKCHSKSGSYAFYIARIYR